MQGTLGEVNAGMLGSDLLLLNCSTTGFLMEQAAKSLALAVTCCPRCSGQFHRTMAAAWHSSFRFTNMICLFRCDHENPQLWWLQVVRRPSFHPCASPLWIVCLVAQSGLIYRTLVVPHSKSPRQSMFFHHSDHLLALSTLRKACFARFSKDDQFCEVIEREMSKGKHGISSIYPRRRVAGEFGPANQNEQSIYDATSRPGRVVNDK